MVDDEKEATVAKEGGGGSPSPPQQGDGRTPQRGFYRRYRPRTFAQVVGQEHVVKVLRNALASGRVFHAYFFSGPKGTGKTTIARILACALNCEKKLGDDACGECVSCQRMPLPKGA
ncbi:MAG: ATP-binding protein [Candidatus Hadarchaeales archaeon]